ncbi:hypothetical protein [Pseudoxanthomonas dokdonensis]|uniref:Uncharacterized protein n=1 Tax=Pseudoxanthomonas dokdonensis TaxID=344882 RepID=A0A0R0CKV3_9GAMM|nr:hypothetical protein [Pseudoxanthomonas dokdonensis]KRG70649.1 hypothetical protein ABB29_06215 [Pseudoxanthomonas dokdonensis]
MNEKLLNSGFALAGAVSLLLLGLSAQPAARMDTGFAAPSLLPATPAALEEDVIEAVHPQAGPSRHRRRAALSMPYFSFARSLRSGS